MLGVDERLLVENPFVEHDNSSNTTAGQIKPAKSDTWSILFLSEVRHLVEKNRPSVGLCFFRNKYQNILPGINHYKKSEWLTRLLGKLSSLVRVFGLRFTVMYDGAIGLIVCSKRINDRINR